MYALSTLVMHHRELFTGHEQRVAPDFEVLRDGPYDAQVAANESSDDVARRILSDLGISGAYAVRGDAHSGTLTIHRNRPIGSYRVTYDSSTGDLNVERQQFGLAFFLEMLHRRCRFGESYLANDLWALMVDVVIAAIVLWAATGIWMWLGTSRTRKIGSLCLIGGSALFSFLLLVL
jgi:hypothetical protein